MRRRIAGRPGLRAGAFLLLLGLLLAGCGPLFDPGVLQERAVAPAPRLVAGQALSQTFRPTRAGLTAVEVLVAVFPELEPTAGDLVVEVGKAGDNARILASLRLPLAGLRHNSRHRLAFPPQVDSAGKTYVLVVRATGDRPAPATLWMAPGDAYTGGALSLDGQEVAGDLALRAYYDYPWQWLFGDLAAALPHAWWLLLALAVILLPGAAVERAFLAKLSFDAAEAAGAWVGLGLSFWAVLFLLVSAAGCSLSAPVAVAILLLCGVVVAASLSRRERRDCAGHGRVRARLSRALGVPSAGVFAITAAALALRFVHTRDLVLPMWVDSVHHALIVDLFAASGRLPADYGPFVPVQPFTYHFGFHLPAVLLVWLGRLAAPDAVLLVGQLLGGLIVLPSYLLAARLTGDRRSGLVAGLVVGLVSTMPAYYVSWGRYPQLAGLAALPVAVALMRAVWNRDQLVATVPASVIAVAGLVLIHPRVALIFAALVVVDLGTRAAQAILAGVGAGSEGGGDALHDRRGETVIVSQGSAGGAVSAARLVRPQRSGALAREVGLSVLWVVAVAAGSAAILSPWFARLAQSIVAQAILTPWTGQGDDLLAVILNAGFPGAVDRLLVAGAVAGVAVGLIARRRAAVVGGLWIGLCLVLAVPGRVGLPFFLFLGDPALAIALFLPVAVLDGVLISEGLSFLRWERWPAAGRAAAVALAAVVAAWGGANLAGIVNPTCVLATPADLEALRWVRDNTPADAAFVVNSRRWQGDTVAGTDGGYWLPVLAGRRASTPPLPYAHASRAEVRRVEALSAAFSGPAAADAAAVRHLALAEGFSYLFIGELGGPLRRETFLDAEGFRLEFQNGRAWVFRVLPE